MNSDIGITESIEAPPRVSAAGSVIVLLMIGVISIAPLLPAALGIYVLTLLFLLLLAAVIKRQIFAVHLSILFSLLFITYQLGASLRIWPFKTLAPLLVYALIIIAVPGLRGSTNWIKKGQMNTKVIRLIIATAVLSAVALIAWVMLLRPDIQHHINNIPELPLWGYAFAGAGFAFFNAAMEEAIFRGVVMEAADSAVGPGYWSVGIQAVPFASFHYQTGFPNGMSGLAMTFVYGIMLGTIRRMSRGMVAPLIAHIAADAVIFSILIYFYFQRQ